MELAQEPPEVTYQKLKTLERIRVALQMAAFSFILLIITEILASILGYRDYYGSILEGYFGAFFEGGLPYITTTFFVTWIMLTIFVDTKSQIRKLRYIMMIVIALFILGMFFTRAIVDS